VNTGTKEWAASTDYLRWRLGLSDEHRAIADREAIHVLWSDTTVNDDTPRVELLRLIKARTLAMIERERAADGIVATLTDEEWMWALHTFPPHTSNVIIARAISERREAGRHRKSDDGE